MREIYLVKKLELEMKMVWMEVQTLILGKDSIILRFGTEALHQQKN